MSIGGAIKLASLGGLDKDDVAELQFQLKSAHKNINAFKFHLMRAFIQNYFWDMAISEKNETIAFCIQVIFDQKSVVESRFLVFHNLAK